MAPRDSLDLNGPWTFATDPQGEGERENWFDYHGFARDVTVPSPWQLYGPDLIGYTGYGWYHRTFTPPPEFLGREVAVRCEAVDYEAVIWVNGVELTRHEGGYTPFEAVIPASLLRPEANHLVLRAFDPKDNAEIPHGKQGSWYTRVSGPWQPISLVARDAIHIEQLHITPDLPKKQAHVCVWAKGADGTPVTVEVLDPAGHALVQQTQPLSNQEAHFAIDIPTPRLWSPGDPALYTCNARIEADMLSSAFGMRSVAFRDGLIYLNDAPLYVRGALDQAFYPETVYRVPSLEAIEHEIKLAKQMGLNLLRKHIKLEDPRYLDACDRLGMLIWEEPACFAKYTPQAKARFTKEIDAMIARDYNHPSIIAWSLYNEEWGLEWRLGRDEEKQAHVEALYEHAKRLDSTRLICDNSGWAHVKTDINDCHRYFTAPDLIRECEADLARYVETPEINFVENRRANAAGVPVLVSEFGCWGLPEPSRIETYYGGKPWWFDAQWAGHVEEFKYPSTAYRSFERYRLDEVFGSLDALARLTQLRMMRALKPIIETMRARADLAGYVVTEFTDIEWESNGWLDYFRQPKAGFEGFAAFNGETIVYAKLPHHNARGGELFEGTLGVSNHGEVARACRVTWQLQGDPQIQGEVLLDVPAHGNSELVAFSFRVPDVEAPASARLELTLCAGKTVLAANFEELMFMPHAPVYTWPARPLLLVGEAQSLEAAFQAAGAPLVSVLTPDTLVVTGRFAPLVRAHVAKGGRALYLAERGDQGPDKGELSFRRLPRGESWDRAASMLYVRPGIFKELPIGPMLGWECEDLFPHHVLALANYMHDFGGRSIELTSNQAELAPGNLHGGYFEGWLGKFATILATVPHGRGTVLVTTLRLLEAYGRQPVGEAMLHALIEQAAG